MVGGEGMSFTWMNRMDGMNRIFGVTGGENAALFDKLGMSGRSSQ